MEKTVPPTEVPGKTSLLARLTKSQKILLGVVGVLLLLLIIGSVIQASAPKPTFSVLPSDRSFLALAFLAFAGGLLSFLSPCTLPILPAYFAFAFQSGRKQIALNTLFFMLGLGTMFSLMGATASTFSRLLRGNQQLLLILGGAVILVFGVMSLIGKGFTGLKSEEETVHSTTLSGSYLFGLTFAVGWSGCVGPILGGVYSLAAATASMLSGVILLFIYTLGLGLPLIFVSTFLGRTSRKHVIWRILKGKGWTVNTHQLVVALLWALVAWRILVAVVRYLFFNDFATVALYTPAHEFGLLALTLAGAFLWVFASPGTKQTTLNLHSTQLFSGVLFILLGILLLSGTLATFNSLIPLEMANWFADVEEVILGWFAR
ncbi:MAG: cytochrome c biogenesis protein CcdA [Chloroflexi bacterium]|nr:cytochrome c biogenesis protein CcdA [Chloroflexota bacterium]MBP8058787.1 cytochrome c biogenesis protein CcdA [Chloroflexota bacterium]